MIKFLLPALVALLITPSLADQVAPSSAVESKAVTTPASTSAVSPASPSVIDAKAVAEAANAKLAGPSEDLTSREDPNRRICKNAAPTGTRLGKRTCLTAAQWAEAQRIAKEGTKNAQTSALMINKKGD